MGPNKFLFGYREQIPGMPEAYWLILRKEKAYTQVTKEECYLTGMSCGLFLELCFRDTREETDREAVALASSFGCRFVSPKEFRRIEFAGREEQVRLALREAERLIGQS